jgi:hypothetical protein
MTNHNEDNQSYGDAGNDELDAGPNDDFLDGGDGVTDTGDGGPHIVGDFCTLQTETRINC